MEDLTTHAFICGVTGSGKTVLGKILLEECALQRIPFLVFAKNLLAEASQLEDKEKKEERTLSSFYPRT